MKPTEEIAVRLVGGAQSAYVQELSYFFLNLLDEVVRTNGAVIRGREIADFERLSRLSREEALAIYYKYRPAIDKQTREVLKTALKKTDDALVGQFVRAMGSRRHMTNLATIIAAQTAQGMNEVLERQNIALAKDQATLWYDVTAEAIARHQAGEPTRAVMERGVTRLANSGLETIDYISGTKTTIDAALRRHIVSQANQARNRLLMQRMDEWEWDLVFVDAHFGARPSHAEWQGKVYSRSGQSTEYPPLVDATGYGTVTGLCGANCVVGDTKVSGPNALAAYRRKYSGEIVTIRTALGHNLTVTPNHPILTPHGWVAANKLSKGDYVFSRVNSDGMPLGVRPNKYEGEPSIKNEFNALGDTFGVNSFLGSTADFHNDGIKNQNVDIVFVDSKLMRNADSKALKHFSEASLFNASRFSNISFGSSSLTKVGMSLFSSSDSIMSGFANKASFFRRISRHLSFHGQTATFGIDSAFFKSISDCCLGNTKLLGDNSFIEPFIPKVNDTFDINTLLTSIGIQAKSFEFAGDNPIPASEMLSHSSDRSPFIVEPDEIISVDTRMWSGHVYNLSTENAWYFANSIVTHNCYHYMTPYVPGYSELPDMDYSEQERITGMTSDEYYAATQKQRRYERLIRSQKREISYLQEVRADAVKQRIRLGELQDKLRQFTHDNHLRRDYERERAWAVSKQPRALKAPQAYTASAITTGSEFASNSWGFTNEYGAILDKDGNVIGDVITGRGTSITFILPEGYKWEDLQATHTHPHEYGGTFSTGADGTGDIYHLTHANLISHTAICHEGTYHIERTENSKPMEFYDAARAAELKAEEDAFDIVYDWAEKERKTPFNGFPQSKLNEMQREEKAKLMHKWFSENASIYGYTYSFTAAGE